MTRSFRWTSMLIVTGVMLGSGCATSRTPVPRLATAPTAERCTAEVEGMNVRDWQQIRADGFTFCAPETWSRNERYDRITAQRRGAVFSSFSWAAPDTAERVVFEVPARDYLVENMRKGAARCERSSLNGRRIGEQDVCVHYYGIGGAPGCPSGYVEVARTDRRLPIENSLICPAGNPVNPAAPRASITYAEPLVRATVYGLDDAWAVAQTVRPASGSGTPGPQ